MQIPQEAVRIGLVVGPLAAMLTGTHPFFSFFKHGYEL
jgi:hypothetical protein